MRHQFSDAPDLGIANGTLERRNGGRGGPQPNQVGHRCLSRGDDVFSKARKYLSEQCQSIFTDHVMVLSNKSALSGH